MGKIVAGNFNGKQTYISGGKFLLGLGVFNVMNISDDIEEIVHIENEKATSMIAKAGWAAAGGAVFGPLGFIAGAIAGGNKTKATYIVKLKTGETFMVEGDKKEYYQALDIAGQPLL